PLDAGGLLRCFDDIGISHSMIVALPRSTLFPYTTLFRSELLEGWLLTEPCALVSAGTGLFAADVLLCAVVPALAVACVPLAPPRDRKSTRLNSSHVASSYAVFCLKKTVKYTDSPPSPNRA